MRGKALAHANQTKLLHSPSYMHAEAVVQCYKKTHPGLNLLVTSATHTPIHDCRNTSASHKWYATSSTLQLLLLNMVFYFIWHLFLHSILSFSSGHLSSIRFGILFRHFISHSILAFYQIYILAFYSVIFFWPFIWHTFWHSILTSYLAFYSGILSSILSGICFGILF